MTTSTATICENLDIFGATFGPGETDNRPLPEPEEIETAVTCLFEPITGLFDDCPLSGDLESMLWGFVNAFHAQVNRLERALDDNERRQADLRERHDGSEVSDTALCEAIDQGRALIDRKNAFLAMFDAANAEFEKATGATWRPRHGSRQRTRNLTAAMIDSRDFERARRQRWTEDNLPGGPYVVVSGGNKFLDVEAIWQRLDRINEKHPAMTLLHGGAPGVDTIAAQWADNRGVAQVRFGLEQRLRRRAGFARNEKMLAEVPIGVITFPGNGVTEALKRGARKMGIPVWDWADSQERCGQQAQAASAPSPIKPEDVIKRIGVVTIARHFRVRQATVASWLENGVPASRVDAVLRASKPGTVLHLKS